MNPFEYVIILSTLILGLGVSQVLVGVSNLITNKKIKWSLPHAMMTSLIFLTQIQDWWITFSYSMEVATWTLTMAMILMVYPILLFVAARILFPFDEIENKPVDMEEYYWRKWPALFMIFLLIAITSIWQNYLFSGIPLTEQILQILLLLTYLIFLVFRIKNRILHIVFLVLQLIGWIGYLIQEDYMIG